MRGGCDCHVHVFSPGYAFAADRKYLPRAADAADLRSHLKGLGLERAVIVQPSVYGTDNSCTLAAVAELGPSARAVAVIDEHADLEALHRAGVRGVRVNVETGGEKDPLKVTRLIEQTARRVRSMGWHVQVYVAFQVISSLGKIETPFVLDHFGMPESEADFAGILAFMSRGEVYIKLSAPYRSPLDVAPLARELIASYPERLLWGSDWPHVPRGARSPDRVQPFEAVEDAAMLERVAGWARKANVLEKILVENPARLYDF